MSDGPGTPRSDGSGEDDFDLDAFEAAFAAHFGETVEEPADRLPDDASSREEDASPESAGDAVGVDSADATGPTDVADADAPEAPAGEVSAKVTAVVLTPLAHAPALAKIMGLAGMDWPVLATATGAVAACALPVPADDVSALTGELPEEIVNVAKALSHTSKYGIVLLSARVTHSPDEGPGGRVSAQRYVAGKLTEDLAPGLVTTGADDVVEQLVLGQLDPASAPGALDPATEAARGPQTPGASGKPTKPNKNRPNRRRS